MAHSCDSSSSVLLKRNALLRDCPGKSWFVTQGQSKKLLEGVITLLMLVFAQFGVFIAVVCFLSQQPSVCEACGM